MINTWDTWGRVFSQSFQSVWYNVIVYLPNIIIAVIIFLAGWLTGTVLGHWIDKIIKMIKLDRLLGHLGLDRVMERGGYSLNSGAFLGGLVKWFVILAFLVASVDVLGLSQVNVFLGQIIGYIPNIIIASLILIVGAFLADFLGHLISGSARASGVKEGRLIGTIVRWAIWIFSLLAALTQLGIAAVLFQTLWTGIVAALALAFGLAFGLGGKDAAANLIDRFSGRM